MGKVKISPSFLFFAPISSQKKLSSHSNNMWEEDGIQTGIFLSVAKKECPFVS